MITELAFIADAQTNNSGMGGQSDIDTPLEVQFDEFMDGGTSTVPLHVSGITLSDLF